MTSGNPASRELRRQSSITSSDGNTLSRLLGSGQRFLQATNLEMPKNGSAADDEVGGKENSKLDLALATANNTTLFDNAGGSERSFPPGNLALMLLTFQCFSPSGTIGVGLWNDVPTVGWTSYPKVKAGQSDHAPCVAGGMLHACCGATACSTQYTTT